MPSRFPELRPEQQIVIDKIYNRGWESGIWPAYGEIYRELRAEGVSDPQRDLSDID